MTAAIRDRIEQAFAAVPMPPDDRVCGTRGDEARDDTEPFKGRDWRDLEADLLGHFHYALCWFTPEAFHYYLPAFLAAGLADPEAIYVISLLQLLRPNDDRSLDPFARARWEQLTDDQRGALQEWLDWLVGWARPGSVFAGEVELARQIVRERYWWR